MILPPVPPGVLRELNERGGGLVAAREWLEDRLEAGTDCPCCGRHSQAYRRPMHATMAADLVRMARRFGVGRVFHVRDLGGHPGDFAKLAHWGLIAEPDVRRPDGGRAGYWKVTALGAGFVAGRVRVPKYVLLYARTVRGFEGPNVDVEEALGHAFDLRELRGAFHWPADDSGRITRPGPEQTRLEDFLGGEAAA